MTAHWYLSVYDRTTEQLTFEERLNDVTNDSVTRAFGAEPDAVGGFEILESHMPFIRRHTNSSVDLSKCIAFVELLEDGF